MTLPIVASAVRLLKARLPDLTIYPDYGPDRVDGSGLAWVEIAEGGTWSPVPNGERRPVLQVRVMADRTRNTSGAPTKDDADARAYAVWEQVDAVLNDHGRRWTDAHSSRRADGPSLTLVPGGDRAVMLTARYYVAHS